MIDFALHAFAAICFFVAGYNVGVARGYRVGVDATRLGLNEGDE